MLLIVSNGSSALIVKLENASASNAAAKESPVPIALDYAGNLSEGSGENIFLVAKGKIYTPQSGSSALGGITRDTVMTLARDLGYEIVEAIIPREMIYTVEEAFFTGTAAEVTPIASVDRIKVGSGSRGPVTKKIQDAFFKMAEGNDDRYERWLTIVK